MDAKSAEMSRGDSPAGDRTRAPWWTWGCASELGPGDVANYRRFMLFTLLWVAVFLPLIFALKTWGEAIPQAAAYGLALLPTLAYLAVVWSYVRFLRHADELTRKIHQEGMVIGFGAGVVTLLGYPVFEAAGAPPGDLAYALMPMVLAYVIGILRAQRRYR